MQSLRDILGPFWLAIIAIFVVGLSAGRALDLATHGHGIPGRSSLHAGETYLILSISAQHAQPEAGTFSCGKSEKARAFSLAVSPASVFCRGGAAAARRRNGSLFRSMIPMYAEKRFGRRAKPLSSA